MNSLQKTTLRSFFLPGGALLLVVMLLLRGDIVTLSASAVDFFYYLIFLAGILLACRFHSSRLLSILIVVLVAHRALEFFSAGRTVSGGTGQIAFEVVAFLLPLNFIAIAFDREWRPSVTTIAPRLGVLFFQSVFVALVFRPGATSAPTVFHFNLFSKQFFQWTSIPQPGLFAMLFVLMVLMARFLLNHEPSEAGLFWALAAILAGMWAGGVGRMGSVYFATAALILVGSIIETSYTLAYYDELTALPARRAFREALTRLSAPYAIAATDIDHFKSFNDTYGHDIGDQVLRMVASQLSRVGGGGKAYRVGGEEFTILFPGVTANDALPFLEDLRLRIAASRFRVRGLPDRRSASRGADRRIGAKNAVRRRNNLQPQLVDNRLSVTISIGVANARPSTPAVEQVVEAVEAADKALYRAKRAGRNRVELDADRPRSRVRRARA